MLTLYYAFRDPASADATEFMKTLQSEVLISAVPVSAVSGPVSGVLLTDINGLAKEWEQNGGKVIWYESSNASHGFKEAVSDIRELDSEDVAEIICHLCELSHPAFSADGFTFVTLGFDDYKTIYKLQQEEPYLLPARIKNLSETELYERYQNEHEFGRLHPLLHPYGIAGADGSLIGYVAVEQSDLIPEAMNLSYYIVPQKRGLGIGQKAVATFLNMQAEAIGGTMLLAVIERSNTASVRLAAACGFRFVKEDHPLYKLSRGDYRILQYKP